MDQLSSDHYALLVCVFLGTSETLRKLQVNKCFRKFGCQQARMVQTLRVLRMVTAANRSGKLRDLTFSRNIYYS